MTISSEQAVIAEREFKEKALEFENSFEVYYKKLIETFPKTTEDIKKIILKNAYFSGAEKATALAMELEIALKKLTK